METAHLFGDGLSDSIKFWGSWKEGEFLVSKDSAFPQLFPRVKTQRNKV